MCLTPVIHLAYAYSEVILVNIIKKVGKIEDTDQNWQECQKYPFQAFEKVPQYIEKRHLESNGRFDERLTFNIFMDMFSFQCKPGQ